MGNLRQEMETMKKKETMIEREIQALSTTQWDGLKRAVAMTEGRM